jgi:hypothetical protein
MPGGVKEDSRNGDIKNLTRKLYIKIDKIPHKEVN